MQQVAGTDLHRTELLRGPSIRSGSAHAQFKLLVEVAVKDTSIPSDVYRVSVQPRKKKRSADVR